MVTITAAVARRPKEPLTIEALDLAPPRPDEVLVRLTATGVCHTDINYRDQIYEIDLPVVLGHEGAGVVEELGDQVEGLVPGDHVVLGYSTCGRCTLCRSGNPAYCVHVPMLNLQGNRPDGSSAFGGDVRSHFFGQSSFATHAVVPAGNLVVVPPEVPLELLGPLGCGVQTGAGAVLRSLRVPAGAALVVFGAGAVGLSAVMAGAAAGAHPIIVVDRVDARRALAAELGATATVNADQDDPVAAVRDLTGGGADFAIEAVGKPTVLHQAVHSLGAMGVCGLVGGVGPGVKAEFDWQHVQLNGITIRGVIEGDSVSADFVPQLIDLYRRGRLPLEKIVRFYDLADVNTAMADADAGLTVKPVLRIAEGRT
ncbi:NAD(P)-dependent alcohol dehydrogenase [Pseudonocardia kujensis]|uniref:NAD(P)-dependent alcohol dehydrogenase n=1 Tax=Pseudonocardia kujensis TaxID=1128675 RepID=UPI001E37588F|nr:NAD(P)-dependent alcohol dehydrogenase [Pseudonocardia kujensis]MCE0766889.1 NAD(P)-dependent alcohol dehydrogenase [Pseudonocardia kujensis]